MSGRWIGNLRLVQPENFPGLADQRGRHQQIDASWDGSLEPGAEYSDQIVRSYPRRNAGGFQRLR